MKSSALLNQSLFRQFGGHTNSLSSSVMVCHPLAPGTYHGAVYHKDSPVGNFIVYCQPGEVPAQADIDLSGFINKTDGSCDCTTNEIIYKVKDGGFAVFYSSQGESGFHVELKNEEKGNYSTRKLKKGDIVISLLLRPGSYEVTGSDKQRLALSVDVPRDDKNYQEYLSTPTSVTLTDKGFMPASIKAMPGQGLVVKLEADSHVAVKLLEATAIKDENKKGSRHRWTKPIPPTFKKKGKKKS